MREGLNVSFNIHKETFKRELSKYKIPFDTKRLNTGTAIILDRNEIHKWLLKKNYTDVEDLEAYDKLPMFDNAYDSD